MAHFIYPQATSTTAFVLDGSTVSPTLDTGNPLVNKPMPVVALAGSGLAPLSVNTGAADATTLRVVLTSDSTISIEEDKNYGVVGANTIRTAAQIGNATGAAEFGSGADSAQTLRVTLSTRSEAAATPVSVRLSDGSGFYAGATETNLTSLRAQIPTTLGSTTMAGSLSVTIANNQTAIPVSGTVTATNAANGTLGATAPTVATQIAGDSAGLLTALQVTAGGLLKVDGSGVTQPISAAALPLPSGAATDSTLSTFSNKFVADFGSVTTALRMASIVGNTTGQADFNNGATSAQTLRVTLASDSRQPGGFTPIQVINRDYSSSSISGTFATLGSTLSATANCVTFFETGGSPIIIGWGGVDKFVVPPGGAESPVLVTIPAATQLQIRTADGSTVNIGRFLMTVLS